MKAYNHAQASARRWGGVPEDYIEVHEFIDSSKMMVADVRHRAMLHSAWGIYLAERVFGRHLEIPRRGDRGVRLISVRDICENHILEDIGRIPSMQDWLDNMEIKPWMGGQKGRASSLSWEELGWSKDVAM